MYMHSRWRLSDLTLRISGVIEGEGEEREELLVLVSSGA